MIARPAGVGAGRKWRAFGEGTVLVSGSSLKAALDRNRDDLRLAAKRRSPYVLGRAHRRRALARDTSRRGQGGSSGAVPNIQTAAANSSAGCGSDPAAEPPRLRKGVAKDRRISHRRCPNAARAQESQRAGRWLQTTRVTRSGQRVGACGRHYPRQCPRASVTEAISADLWLSRHSWGNCTSMGLSQ